MEVKNVTKIYNGEKNAVDNILFTVNNGEIFAFIGHNGAGKTTTIRMLLGIIKKIVEKLPGMVKRLIENL